MFAMLVRCFLSVLRDVRDAAAMRFVSVTEMFAMLVKQWLLSALPRRSQCWCSGFCQRYEMFRVLVQWLLSALVRGAGTVAFVSVRDDDDDELVSFQMLTSHQLPRTR